MEDVKAAEFVTLGECSNFFLTMLGDFASKNGIDAKAKKDFVEEKTKAEFGKYNQEDSSARLGNLHNQFYKQVFRDDRGFSLFSALLIRFPGFLQRGIKYYDNRLLNYFTKKQLINYLILNYAVFYCYHSKGNTKENLEEFIADISSHHQYTYKDILEGSRRAELKLSETAKWSTVEEVIKAGLTEDLINDVGESVRGCRLVQHYLYLGFKKALQECFGFDETEVYQLEYYLANKIELFVANYPKAIEASANYFEYLSIEDPYSEQGLYALLNAENRILYDMFYTEQQELEKHYAEFKKNIVEFRNIGEKNIAMDYFMQPEEQLTPEKTEGHIKLLESFNDDHYKNAIIPWYKARTAIFNLTFTDKKKDEQLKKQACEIFRDVFNRYKYGLGVHLQEFLSDAIVCDVYCNPKKDIFGNSQDNTGESSLIMPGKAYWEFGFALGIFPGDSTKTYLATYNAEVNFWTNFPPVKYVNREAALKVYEKETVNSEFKFIELLQDFNEKEKIENLVSRARTDLRQPLGNRYYSNTSIRVMKQTEHCYDETLESFIKDKTVSPEILYTTDECGANALMRALHRYKMLCYGYTDEMQLQRSRILLKQDWETVSTELNKMYNENKGKWSGHYKRTEVLRKKLKKQIILPLIKKEGAAPYLLDEAIALDFRHCVSALQLAIDSYDVEIVQTLLDHLPKGTDLSQVNISQEKLTALEYAECKLYYVTQYAEMLENHDILPLKKLNIEKNRNVERGILEVDQKYYDETDDLYQTMCLRPDEECGAFLTYSREGNGMSEQQINLERIIKIIERLVSTGGFDRLNHRG